MLSEGEKEDEDEEENSEDVDIIEVEFDEFEEVDGFEMGNRSTSMRMISGHFCLASATEARAPMPYLRAA